MPTIEEIVERDDVHDPQIQEILIDYLTPCPDNSDVDNETNRSSALSTAIRIHEKRRRVMKGLHDRIRLEPASRPEWKDPREADGIPIMAREPMGTTKVNHRLHTTFDKTIIGSKASYFVGDPPEFTVSEDEGSTDELSGQMLRTGFTFKINELAQRATGRGTSFILLSSPPEDENLYVMLPQEWNCIVLYDTVTEKPAYGIRYWFEDLVDGRDEDSEIIVELYTDTEKMLYKGAVDSLVMCEDPIIHAMEGIPLIEFANNTERLGDVELTMSLQDAYDVADSDLSSEVSQLRLSYLALLGDAGGDIDDAWLASLMQTGVFTMVAGDAKFVEKNLNSQAVENLKDNLEARIYRYSNSYNPDELGSDGTMTAYQIRRKLFRLESSTIETEALFRMGLYRLIDIISEFYSLNIDPADVSITFTRNTPRNVVQDIQDMRAAGLNISQQRMAELSPLDIDQAQNQAELEEEAGAIPLGPMEGDGTEGIIPPGGDVEQAKEIAALSGIQIKSANEIIRAVADGTLSREGGLAQLEEFLNMSPERAKRVMGPTKAASKRVVVRAVPNGGSEEEA